MCSRSRSRSKVTWYGHFCDFTKIASYHRQMAGTLPNLHMVVIQGVLKVKVEVKGHVKRALLWCHEMFAIQYFLTFCLYMHSLYEALLHSPSSISVRQLDVMSTSWNELFRHWLSGCTFWRVRSPLIWYINFSFVHLQYITSYIRLFWWSLVIVRDNYSSPVFIFFVISCAALENTFLGALPPFLRLPVRIDFLGVSTSRSKIFPSNSQKHEFLDPFWQDKTFDQKHFIMGRLISKLPLIITGAP